MQSGMRLGAKFASYAPNFKGRATPEESIRDILSVINASSLKDGYGGAFVSHLGKGQPWL
jgi:hypothetical protein